MILDPAVKRAKDRVEAHRASERDLLIRERRRDELKPDGLIEVSNLEAQLGRPMLVKDVVKRLQKMNKNLYFEVSKADPGKMGIYVIESRPEEGLGKRFVCGMENGFMPEFSVQHAKPRRAPDPDVPGHWQTTQVFGKETRGWRTVLARLIREKLVTEPQVSRYFSPETGRDSARWKLLTKD